MAKEGVIRSHRMIRDFPEAARAAFRSTKAPKWEDIPAEPDEKSTTHVEWCNTCNKFHKITYVFGHRVSHKAMFVVVVSIDEDGERTEEGVFDVDSPKHTQALRSFDKYTGAESFRQYYHQVAQGYDDYLEIFERPTTKEERWMADVCDSDGKLTVVGTKRVGTTAFVHPINLPLAVLQVLDVDRSADNVMTFKGIGSVAELREAASKDGAPFSLGPANDGKQTIFYNIQAPADKSTADAAVRKLAMNALEALDEPANRRPGDRR